jgi:hypothetical protein
MLDVVAADEDEAAAGVDCSGIQHLEPRLTVLSASYEGRRAVAATDHPQDSRQQEKADTHSDDGDHEAAAIGAYKVSEHLLPLLMRMLA